MSDATDHCTACERLDIIEAMLDTLAERLDQGNTGHQAGNPNQKEELTMTDNTSTNSMNDITDEVFSLRESGVSDKWFEDRFELIGYRALLAHLPKSTLPVGQGDIDLLAETFEQLQAESKAREQEGNPAAPHLEEFLAEVWEGALDRFEARIGQHLAARARQQ